MEIVGTVISVNGDMATVSVRRVSACGENCANCHGACEATTATTTAKNTVGAVAGDVVKVESSGMSVIRAAVFLYMLPVLVAVLIAAVTYSMGLSDILTLVLSVIGFFGSFAVVKCFEKRIAPKSYITKVLGKDVK